MGLLDHQTAVVTGSGRGWGRAIARELARQGAFVWICARTETELDETSRQIDAAGGRSRSRSVDLGNETAVAAFAETVLHESQRVDVLVNNAGILKLTPIEELTSEEWSRTLAVNLTAAFLLIRSFLPGMRELGGSIINVSSRAGVMGFKDEAAYCTTKFGLEGLTRALAVELAGAKVSVNTITPGLKIKPTSITEKDLETLPEDERSQWNTPELLNPAFVFLARLRGEVSGLRFDAHRLSEALRREGLDISASRAKELAE